MYINFDDDCQIDLQKLVISVADKTSQILALPQHLEATVIFVDSKKMKQLNNDARKLNKPTDVLSFPNIEFESLTQLVKENFPHDISDDDNIYLGDIAICLDEVAKDGSDLAIIVTHGILHLLGYDHVDEVNEKEMFELQERIANGKRI